MSDAFTVDPRHLESLSRLVFRGYTENFEEPSFDQQTVSSDLACISAMDTIEREAFLGTADLHHVAIRALRVIEKAAEAQGDSGLRNWGAEALHKERLRIENAVGFLERICGTLQAAGCDVVVIKSLDHWPDLGSDLDLYTSGDEHTVIATMQKYFGASLERRSWGDRLANKWNFSIPGLAELVEIHVRYLGQTGEHWAIARRLVARSRTRVLHERTFRVAAPEERVVISTLQRMYRHFYFRLCDMVDSAALLRRGDLNFFELRQAAQLGGIWPGVATYLSLVSEYAGRYGLRLELPAEVIASAYSDDIRVFLRGNFLRVPMRPAAGLYGSQLLRAGTRGDVRAVLRLPLLPPLALSALVAYRVTGSDKGVW